MKNLTAIFVMAILLFFTSNDLKASQNPSSRGGALSGLLKVEGLKGLRGFRITPETTPEEVDAYLRLQEDQMRLMYLQLAAMEAEKKRLEEEEEEEEEERKQKKAAKNAAKRRKQKAKKAAKAAAEEEAKKVAAEKAAPEEEAKKVEAEKAAAEEEKAAAEEEKAVKKEKKNREKKERRAARIAARKAEDERLAASTSSPVSLATIDTRGPSPDSVTDSLALAADSEQQSQEELKRRLDNLKVYSPFSAEFCLFSEEKAKIFIKTILRPFLEQEENSNLHLVINGGYLVRTYAKQKDIEHFTGDIDFLLVTKDGSEIVFEDLRSRLQLFFYKHQRDLEKGTLNYKVESDKTYGIKVAYQEHGGPCIPFMDIGFSKSALEKVEDMGLEAIYDENLEYDFGVPCTLLSLGNYKIELENRLREYLDPESLLSKKYMHKLSSWMNQLRIIYLLEWDNFDVDNKASFLDLYEKLQEINPEKIE
jgi:outer membrane biosynthesis protein TonB